MAILQSALYVISEALLVPVMILVIVLFVVVVFRAGEVLSEFLRRRDVWIPRTDEASGILTAGSDISRLSPAVRRFVRAMHSTPAGVSIDVHAAYSLREIEESLEWDLAKIRRLVRVGPMLGLMGTLIPMGQALAALTEGAMDKMANALIIAFTTTIVGLFIAGVAYVLAQYKGRWVSQDRRVMELLAEVVSADKR